MRRVFAIGALLIAGCVAGPVDQSPGAVLNAWIPTGARIEPSGYATVLSAPSPDYRKTVEPQPPGPASEAAWYAASNNISVAEAARRQAAQQAIMPEFERMLRALRVNEAGNFTAPRMIHQPDWAYVFYFKRDPERTLAKYTSNPRFKAAAARYTQAELDALVRPLADRFTKAGIIGGYSSDATFGTADFMMTVTEAEYRAIAAREAWGPVPDAIKLEFPKELAVPPVSREAAPFVRAFAQNDKATGIQLTALGSGRIVLGDGCLQVEQQGTPTRLAYFHKETGLGVDAAGYLALINRATGKPSGRIGEIFVWGGPNGMRDDMPGLADLRARCGTGPIAHVGNPESKAAFDVRFDRR